VDAVVCHRFARRARLARTTYNDLVTPTNRLYYTDAYLRDFRARVVDRSPDARTVYLDRTAFYPTSGGQPYDLGTVAGAPIVEVVDEDDRIAHKLSRPFDGDTDVDCAIDWTRRFDHMQQHTGQHLLSAVFEELFHLHTVSFHLGADSATIDLEGGPVDSHTVLAVEHRTNELVSANLPVTVTFEDSRAVQGLRKPSERDGTLRIISIADYDRSACGGTHVRTTGEIGSVLLRKAEKIRQSTRIEFVCGNRAVRRARADFEALTKVAQLFSASLDEAPSMVANQLENAKASEKSRRKLELDLAAHRGRDLYRETAPGPDSIRRVTERLDRGNLEDLRAVAQNFIAQPKAVFLAVTNDPPSVLFAASEDTGIDAGKLLKVALTESSGRGGGTPRIAQGSVPDLAALDTVLAKLR
jgi:alanyl-tRNA synthetase